MKIRVSSCEQALISNVTFAFQTIQTVCPDVVMVELCKSRVSIIQYDEETLLREAKDINFSKLKMAVKEVRLLIDKSGTQFTGNYSLAFYVEDKF